MARQYSVFLHAVCVYLSIYKYPAYIIDGPHRPVCPSVRCENGGTLMAESCTCSCNIGYGGFFCEKELKETMWPKGQYSLLSSVFGCPEKHDIYGWHRGYVNMTLGESSKNQRWKLPYPPDPNDREVLSADPHILGPYYLRSLQWNFCTRHDNIDEASTGKVNLWPRGHYCVFRYGDNCPNGFSVGQVTMSTYRLSWSDVDGTIPHVTINGTTGEPSFAYCCRADDDVDVAETTDFHFPSSFPFLLTKPNTSDCMEVISMSVTEERFDLADEFHLFEFDGEFNMFNATSDGYQRLGLCYYVDETHENCYDAQDGGFSYQGTVNVSRYGNPCLHWYDLPDEASVETFPPHRQYVGDFDHNHCRTYFPYGSLIYFPWCFVNRSGHVTFEECDVPLCDADDSLEVIGKFKPVYSVPDRDGDPVTNAVDGLIAEPFVSDRPRQKPWLQVDLEETLEVHAVMVHRVYYWFANNHRFVSVHISDQQWDFLNYGALQCEERRFPRRALYFKYKCYRPIVGQYVTIRNFDDPDPTHANGNNFRFEIAEIEVLVKRKVCRRRMGLVSGAIRDFQLGGAMETNTNSYEDGRIFNVGEGWCSGPTSQSYFEVDMIVPVVIDGIEIQGSRDSGNINLVREFYIEYGVEDGKFVNYTTPTGQTKIFKTDPNAPLEMLIRFMFQKSFVARKLRLQIIQPATDVCLKLEIIGCPKRVVRDLYCKDDDVTTYGYEAVTNTVFWIENIPRFYNVTVDQCLELCDGMHNCVGTLHGNNWCSLTVSSRYNPHYQHWVVKKLDELESVTFTKLCVIDLVDYTQCNSIITEPTVLASPSYPLYYGMLLDCRWEIHFPEGTFVRVEIKDLHLPKPVSSTELREIGYYDVSIGSCADQMMLDSLIIDYTNQHSYSRSLLVSDSNHMVIQLKSCARYAVADDLSGFKMVISQSEYPGCGITTSQCDSTCTGSTGIIVSPGFPTPFSETALCRWRIVGQPGQYIVITFQVLDLQSTSSDCDEARVIVRDVPRFKSSQASDGLLGRFCALNTPDGPLKSSWEIIEIDFETDADLSGLQIQGNGFMAEYEMIYQVQEVTNSSGDGCLDGWEAYNNSCYSLFSEPGGLTWVDAQRQCNLYSGHLVSLQTRREANLVHYLLTSQWTRGLNDSQDFYIGLRKTGENGFFQDLIWSDGSPVTFTAWPTCALGKFGNECPNPLSVQRSIYREKIWRERIRYKYQSAEGGTNQPDGQGNERCTFISLFSIHSINNWHDVPCAYDQINRFICEYPQNSNSTVTSGEHVATIVRNTSVVHHPNLFYCESGDIINSVYMCDGTEDCTDGSDEICGNMEACSGYQFRCQDGNCIPGDLLCDFRLDCKDGSDESICEYRDCDTDEWKCNSGQCIPEQHRCDVKTDCFDGSDEDMCDLCQITAFQCYDETCTSNSRVCDNYYDCSGRFYEDEIQEDCSLNSRLPSCAIWYSIGRKTNGSYSVLLGTNDGVSVECRFVEKAGEVYAETVIHHHLESEVVHISKEMWFTPQYKATDIQIMFVKHLSASCRQHIRFDCSYTRTFTAYWTGDDGVDYTNSRNVANQCACPYVNNCDVARGCTCGIQNSTEWYGLDHDAYLRDEGFITNMDALPIRSVYLDDIISSFGPVIRMQLGPLICEEKIEYFTDDAIVCDNRVLGPADSVCKMHFDVYGDIVGCRDLSHLEHCEHTDCQAGFTKCPKSYCIWNGLVCDGVRHCPNGEDEINCGTRHYCLDSFHCRGTPLCIPTSNVCDGVVHCPQADDELLCNISCPAGCTCDKRSMICDDLTFQNMSLTSSLDRSISETRILKVHLSHDLSHLNRFIGLTHLDLSSSGLIVLVSGQFRFANNLIKLDLGHNYITEIPPATFDGLSKLTTLNLIGNPLTRLTFNAFIGLTALTDLDLSGFSLGELKTDMFTGLISLRKLNLSSSNIDEADDNTFEPLQSLVTLDLRQNEILDFGKYLFYGLESLSFLYVDSFTLCCIKPAELPDEQCLSPKNEFSSCSDLLRNDILSVCIWIIGILATVGNTVVLVIRFILDKDGLKKTYNVFVCNLSIADCLMGVYLIILGIADAVFRGEYTWNDFKWRNGTACKLAGIISTIASEGSVIFLCLITIDRLLVVKFPFGNVRIRRSMSIYLSLLVWVAVLLLACTPLIGEAYYDWSFYSRSAVCLPLPLTRDRPIGYEYGVGLFIVFNFIAFLLIATAQIVIYLEVSSTRNNVASKGRRVDISVARKLFFVAITDFMCWFPIGLMGIMALNGQVISGEVYAWIAVFVLPINSALNPFLYTLGSSISAMVNKMEGKLTRTKSSRKERDTKSMSEVVSSDMFVFGNFDARDKRKMTLARYLVKNRVCTMDVYRVARHVSKALQMLHSTEMVHGRVAMETVMITTASGKINRVMLRSSPLVCMDEEDFKKDIDDFGCMLRALIRLVDKN